VGAPINKSIDFQELNQTLLANAVDYLYKWLPGGKLIGAEYQCSSVNGGQGSSCKVNINTGLWCDFASLESGGDLVSLYAANTKQSQVEAARSLLSDMGGHFSQSEKVPHLSKPGKMTPVSPNTDTANNPPIRYQDAKNEAPESIFTHYKHGAPSHVWTYLNENQGHIFYVARYDTADGKQFLPVSYQNGVWVKKQYPDNRPLYGLEYLDSSNENVLIVEGEKAADAARILLGHNYQIITWPGGSQAINKADWSPIFGKKILIWPDNDEAGITAAGKIAHLLLPHCPTTRVLHVQDTDFGHKFDAADFIGDYQAWLDWARPIIKTVSPLVPEVLPPVELTIEDYDQEYSERFNDDPGYSDPGGFTEAKPIKKSKYEMELPSDTVTTQWTEMDIVLVNGKVKGMELNAYKVLQHYDNLKDVFWFDTFLDKFMVKWPNEKERPRQDHDDFKALCIMQGPLQMVDIKPHMVKSAISTYCKENAKNCAQEWLNSLKWDGKNRVTLALTEYFSAPDEAWSYQVSQNMFVAMVARIMDPGVKVDNMVILEGRQGARKSSALNALVGDWFVETGEKMGSKDFYMELQGNMIVEIAELDSFSKSETNTTKKIVSQRIDNFRPPYGSAVVSHPRQCIFVGTTNDDHYLKDATGARRYWPITCGEIDIELIKKDREQLFAEAVELYKQGTTWWEVDQALALTETDARYDNDPWFESVEGYIKDKYDIYTIDILKKCLKIDIDKVTKREQMRVGSIMKKLGYNNNKRSIIDKNRIRVWTK